MLIFFLMKRNHDNWISLRRSLGKRVRECSMKHYNYVVTVGAEELQSNTLSIRSREQKDLLQLSLQAFEELLKKELQEDVN